MEDSIVMSNPNDPYNILSTLGWSQNNRPSCTYYHSSEKGLKNIWGAMLECQFIWSACVRHMMYIEVSHRLGNTLL